MKKPILASLKEVVERLPEPLGQPLALVPFSMRAGMPYTTSARAIARVERSENGLAEKEIAARLRRLLQTVVESVQFYRDFYRESGFSTDCVRSLDDWERVPIVTKAHLQTVPLAVRLAPDGKGFKINTGGTSGQPLEFVLDRAAFSREWAHMHHIWSARGYRPKHSKLTLRGKHFDSNEVLRYNALHNEYVVNANVTLAEVVKRLSGLQKRTVIRWVHGYPSLVAELAHALNDSSEEELALFRSRLFGVLLGSEYPAPVYRSVIESVLSSNIVSWYGHSEMAMLARETSLGVYESLPTYGYAEAAPMEYGSGHRLLCTSLHNRVHPFIRYDTGDIVEPLARRGGSLAFRITEGRIGDFVLDKYKRRHSLTAIIFGRHHPAFELIEHIQVREESPGVVSLVVTPRDKQIDASALWRGFDLQDLDIDWRVEIVSTPVRTPAGKICLKIRCGGAQGF